MSFRVPALRHAVLAWASISVIGGIGTGYSRANPPLLERHRPKAPGGMKDERALLTRKRDAARDIVNIAHQRTLALALFDSMAPRGNAVTLDVRVPDAGSQLTLEASLRRYWRANAATPSAAPVVIAVRAAPRGRGTNSQVSIDGTSCRTVVFVNRSIDQGGRSGYFLSQQWFQSSLGTCLFAARYGLPGAAAASLLKGIDERSSVPCFPQQSMAASYRCRSTLRDGPRLPTTWNAGSWFGSAGAVRLACGARRDGACERWWSGVQPGLGRSRRRSGTWLLPALELDLQPTAFSRFWTDSRTTDAAYLAHSGRPFSHFLSELAVARFAHYSPSPTLRPIEATVSGGLILIALIGAMFAYRRRTAN